LIGDVFVEGELVMEGGAPDMVETLRLAANEGEICMDCLKWKQEKRN